MQKPHLGGFDMEKVHKVTNIRDKNEFKLFEKAGKVVLYTPSENASSEDIRRMLKNTFCHYIGDIEYAKKADKLHQKNLRVHNHHMILCKENNIGVIIDCQKLMNLPAKDFGVTASRVKLLGKLAKKHKVELIPIWEGRSQNDLKALLSIILNPPKVLSQIK